MSVQFSGKQFEFTQPDGTKLKVRGWGDQHAALFRTLEGYPVIRNPVTRFYEYAAIGAGNRLLPTGQTVGMRSAPSAVLAAREFSAAELKSLIQSNPGLPMGSARWRVRSERKRRSRHAAAITGITPAPPSRNTIGRFVGLCILIDFPDVRATISPDQVRSFLNGDNYSGFGNSGSVKSYFFDVSGGKVEYTSVVTEYVTAANPRDYYTDESIEQPVRAYELILAALNQLKDSGFDFTQLTADDEQYIYAINVYYAGPCVNNWAQGLWPHSHHLAHPVPLAPGRKAYDYQFTNMGEELTLGTFCHENGHMICDFPDLYDYGYESAGAGQYCLMCSGAIADPKNPAQVGAYLKYRAGWMDSLNRLSAGQSNSLSAGGNHFCLYPKDDQEYFILENRRNSQRDSSLPCAGLAIWHVDERGSNSNEEGTPSKHYECALMQADGQFNLEHNTNQGDPFDLFPNGGKTAFDDVTTPRSRWWDGSSSGLSVRRIVDAGSAVTFTT